MPPSTVPPSVAGIVPLQFHDGKHHVSPPGTGVVVRSFGSIVTSWNVTPARLPENVDPPVVPSVERVYVPPDLGMKVLEQVFPSQVLKMMKQKPQSR
jgi:hypothetical protein